MSAVVQIEKIQVREVFDSRGFPTVEVDLWSKHPKISDQLVLSRGLVPSGASTGVSEALELRDGDEKRLLGKGVLKAVANVKDKIAPALVGQSFASQSQLDDFLRELDGTENKSKLGANALLAVSMAFARALAQTRSVPLYCSLANDSGADGVTLPVPLMNILNGGEHADNDLAIQEFMIVPFGFNCFKDALTAGVEVFHHLKKILKAQGVSTSVGDEGGFAPNFEGQGAHDQALKAILQAIKNAGYRPGEQISLALDSAASEFAKEHGGEHFYQFEGKKRTATEMVSIYQNWCKDYPIVSIEDGLAEQDWTGWSELTQELGSKVQLVGDDLFVTNPQFLKKGIESKVANSVLIKLNQIGTVTETLETIRMAKQAGYTAVTSHRSGETEDSFIADLAVGTDCGQIKTGSASRTDRMVKYNQLLRIEEELGERARFVGKGVFQS